MSCDPFRQQTLKQQLKEKENTISELNRMHTHHKGIISDHEGAIRVMKREKDDLQTRYFFTKTFVLIVLVILTRGDIYTNKKQLSSFEFNFKIGPSRSIES